MKYYAQFFHRGVVGGNLIEACGDRAVVILDGRISKRTMGEIAAIECKRRGFEAWQIHRGDFRKSTPVSQVWSVVTSTSVKDPVWLSAHGM